MFLCYFLFCHQMLIVHLLYARLITGAGDSVGYKTNLVLSWEQGYR